MDVFSSQVITDLKKDLEAKKAEYLNLLQTLIVKPAKSSGYYPSSAQSKLYAVEGKIKMLSSSLGINEGNWCKNEKNKVLKQYYVDNSAKKKKIYIAAGIGAVAVIIALIIFINYLSSLGDMQRFEERIQSGDNFVSAGKLSNAIDSYTEAYKEYDGFKSSTYKQNAFAKISATTDKIIDNADSNNSTLYIALQIVNNLQTLNLEKDEQKIITEKADIINSEIDKRVSKGHNTLIGNISANSGKLDDNSKKLLNELLLLSPNDYWLNFIKSKENE